MTAVLGRDVTSVRDREGGRAEDLIERVKHLLSLTNNQEESAIILSTCDTSSFMTARVRSNTAPVAVCTTLSLFISVRDVA